MSMQRVGLRFAALWVLCWGAWGAEWPEAMLQARADYIAAAGSGFKPVVTGVFTGATAPEHLVIDIRGRQELWLFTEGVPDYNYCQSIWGEPELVAADGTRTKLTEIKPVSAKVGWGSLLTNINHLNKGLQVRDRRFTHGFWSHADSALQFKLDGAYVTLETWVGIDAAAGSNGHARFLVGDQPQGRARLDGALTKVFAAFPGREALGRGVAEAWFDAPDAGTSELLSFATRLAESFGELGRARLEAVRGAADGGPAALLPLIHDLSAAKAAADRVIEAVAGVSIAGLRRAIVDLAETFPESYTGAAAWLARLDRIQGAGGIDLPQRCRSYEAAALALAPELVTLQQEALLANPLLDFGTLLLIRRNEGALGLPANWQSNSMLAKTGYNNDICALDMKDRQAPLRTVYRPAKDAFVGDVDLHFAGDRMLFSQSDPDGPWHVYEAGSDGSGLRRVTPEAEGSINNYDPCYLPDGAILYTSTAAMVAVPCVYGSTPVAHLFRLEADGKTTRQVTFDQEHAWCPSVLENGRVLYLRWEYADLPHSNSRLLFQCFPDGTNQSEFYGSNSYWPNGVFYARAIPGQPTRAVGIVTGHHGVPRMGELVVFDTARGRQEATGVVQRIPGFGQPVEALCRDALVDGSWPRFLHPYPLGRADGRGSGKFFLVAAKPQPASPWGLYLADTFDNLVLIRAEPGFALLEPLPLAARPRPPVVPSRVDTSRRDGLVYLNDIYRGGGLAGIPKGTVSTLRVFTYTFGYRGVGGLYGTIGMDGPWDCRRLLGTVPVDGDGSAFFRVPANTPIAVQPLDAEGKALQVMRSWFTVMPGETLSCVGCHEQQNQTPPLAPSAASRRSPDAITPWQGPTRNIAFRREVQPVLDRHCVGCHDGTTEQAGRVPFSLRDEPMKVAWSSKMSGSVGPEVGGRFSEGYRNLHRYVRHPGIESDMHRLAPMDYHADTTELLQILRKGHFGVSLSPGEWERLTCWIDLNTPFHGEWSSIVGTEFAAAAEKTRGDMRRRYANVDENDEDLAQPEALPELPAAAPAAAASTPTAAVPAAPVATGVAAPPAAPGLPRRQIVDLGGGVRLGFVFIPPGDFVMGSASGHPDEQPAHPVRLERGFWMSENEITNQAFRRFAPDHDSRRESKQGYQFGVMGYRLNTAKQPVVRVSWEQAVAFARWVETVTGLPASLPTEEQWEYACRAGSTTPFWFGPTTADFATLANLGDRTLKRLASNPYTEDQAIDDPPEFDDWVPKAEGVDDGVLVSAPVGHYQANPWGLFDMHGNVWEWTRSDYGPYPGAAAGAGTGALAGQKVVRGGSWRDRPQRCTSSYRLAYRPYAPVFNVGFRLVLDSDAAELSPRAAPSAGVADRRSVVVADSGQRKLLCFSGAGETLWEIPDVSCYDLQVLPNGHVLYCDAAEKQSRVVEFDPAARRTVWEYVAPGEVFSCQRLADGMTLVGECSSGRLVEVDAAGKVARLIPIRTDQPGHGALRWARKTPAGTYVAAHLAERCVREYGAEGQLLRQLDCPYPVFGVEPLANGHLLVSCERALLEFDAAGRVVWHLFEEDIPGLRLRSLSGISALPGGNILVCNWLGHDREGDGEPLFEISRDKQIAWMLPDASRTQWVGCAGLLPAAGP
jgi:formylglycine-generating enzyme required for sulfatase activity